MPVVPFMSFCVIGGFGLNLYLQMVLSFAKVGVMTFGGGYSMLPFLQREIVDNKGWATEDEMIDYYAIGQCTPGVIAVNTATFIGYRLKGVLGAVCATLGILMPSVIIITIIAKFLCIFASYEVVQNAFSGIRVAVCALILHTIIRMAKKGVVDIITLLIIVFSFLGLVLFGFSPVTVVVAAGVIGITVRGGKKQ